MVTRPVPRTERRTATRRCPAALLAPDRKPARSAEFEPVGTHQAYRQQGLSSALLQHGRHEARSAGATRITVNCLGGAVHQAARGLYYSVGFQAFTRDVPQVKHAPSE